MTKTLKIALGLFLAGSLVTTSGCQPADIAATVAPTEPVALPTNTPVPPTETHLPTPTEEPTTTPKPTETPIPEPTKELPEVQVTRCEDTVGTWQTKNGMTITTQANGAVILKDGTGNIIDSGQCQFEGDLMVATSKNCTKQDGARIITYTCTGTYRVFLAKDGDTPVYLRYELVEDPNMTRSNIMTMQLWMWVEE